MSAWGGSPGSRGGPHGLPRGRGSTTSLGASQNPHPALPGLDAAPALPCAGHRCPLVAPAHGSTTGPGTPGLQLDFFSPKSCQEAAVVGSHPAPSAGRNLAPLGAKAASPSHRRAAGGGHASPWHQLAPRPGLATQPPEPTGSPPAPAWLRCARRGRVSRHASAGWPRPPSLEAGAGCERWSCRPCCSTEPSTQPTAIVLIPG